MNDKPAFPQAPSPLAGLGGLPGLSRRELFAAMAMQGLVSSNLMVMVLSAKSADDVRASLVKDAVLYADALIAELDKQPEKER